MEYVSRQLISETQLKKKLTVRMLILRFFLLVCVLIVVARLIELQIFKHESFFTEAQRQHKDVLDLEAARGEIFAINSKTGEKSVLATNSTLDMVYVDPLLVDDSSYVAKKLSETLLTKDMYTACSTGSDSCPHELRNYFLPLFYTEYLVSLVNTGAILPDGGVDMAEIKLDLPDYEKLNNLFYRDIETRISEKYVTQTILQQNATIKQLSDINKLNIPGIITENDNYYIKADLNQIKPENTDNIARALAPVLNKDVQYLKNKLRKRERRYVKIMQKLPFSLSQKISQLKTDSQQLTQERKKMAATAQEARNILDPLRSVVLQNENWRFYPDGEIASQIIGFLNTNNEALYGIERTFQSQLRGQKGYMSTVSDERGRDIFTADQAIVEPKDGDTIILTIDRFVQKTIEDIMAKAIGLYEAESGQAIVLNPKTGRIIAMVNAPLFNSNNYAEATKKVLIYLPKTKREKLIVELYHPKTNEFVIRGFIKDFFTDEGRLELSEESKKSLAEIENLYHLEDIVRYYLPIGETTKLEVFPTEKDDIWMKYENEIGVGAYKNRAVQDIYEPGSVMKAVTMAIALDEGEVEPSMIYDDAGPVKVDEYTIDNALEQHYGVVNMTECLIYSINTCMTDVSMRLGKRLFHRMLTRFGFGQVTGIELTDEQPGSVLPWRKWSDALLATAAYGQGISATPLQMAIAFGALANNGKLMKPIIVDSIIHSDGSVEVHNPEVVDQVITPKTAETITAMLVSTVNNGPTRQSKVPGYLIAAKTGTSQIPGPSGKYETGTGSTFASIAGYAPVNQPKFVILVKFDRPKTVVFGSRSAAPVFKEIAAFLFDYYGLPPDDPSY